MRKLTAILLTSALAGSVLTGCGAKATEGTASATPKATESATTVAQQELNIAIFQGGYGRDYWDGVAAEFEKENPGVKVNIEANPEIGEIIRPKILSGNAPDFIYLPSSNASGIASALIKDKGLADLTDVFTDEIKAKMLPGFLESPAMQPYGDGKIYLAPLYYSATGLFYNADFFEKNGLKAPVTWDDFFALGEKGKELKRPLLTYQGIYPGYMEALLIPAMVSSVGPENFAKAENYQDAAWEQDGIKKAMSKIAEIGNKGYLMDGTVALDHTQSQSQWLLGKAMFIPCGAWLQGEMKDAPKEEGFKWGFVPSPVFDANSDKYVCTAVEEMYIPATAKNLDLAKKFLAYQYSDKAVALNAEKAKGVPPVKGAAEVLKPIVEEATYATYQVFENGYKPYIPRFATVEGTEVNPRDELFNQITPVMNKELTGDAWSEHMEKTSDSVRDKIVK